MKKLALLTIPVLFLSISCTKESTTVNEITIAPAPPVQVQPVVTKKHTHSDIYNPIVGTWEIGAFIIACPDVDTIIYPNERGDYMEFKNNDSVYYTFNTTHAFGLSPYEIIDSLTFVLGDTMHIISYDGIRLTTTNFSGQSQRWNTYIKH